MRRKSAVLLVVCCLQCVVVHLKAESITYDFSSSDSWLTESGGSTHPQQGVALGKIYYAETNDCFVGKSTGDKKVYFSSDGNGGLMVNQDASLKIPDNPDWIINKITIHSHRVGSASVKVNIYTSHDTGPSASTALTWTSKDADYVYEIKESYRQSSLYIKVANSSNARISSVTIDYTSIDNSLGDSSDELSVPVPTLTPGTSVFSSEFLDVTITAVEGCEIYYTTDGSTPSYTDPNTFVGTKGNEVTIAATDAEVTLMAMAVDPATGKCSEVTSATYTYMQPTGNDGTEERPYTVAEVKMMTKSYAGKWVRGTIYGTMKNNTDFNQGLVTSGFAHTNHIVIGDGNVQIPVQLPSDSDIKSDINLKDHPYLKGKEILVYGDLMDYCYSQGVQSTSKYKITYDVPINSYGYATLFLDMPVAAPVGCTVYYCTVEGDIVNLLPLRGTIPAGVGVIIEYLPNTDCRLHYTTDKSPYEEAIRDANLLIGYTEDMVVEDSEHAYYALNAKDGKVGFYIPKTATSEGVFTAKANKAYLKVSTESQAVMFLIRRETDETAISPVTHVADDTIYDLQGRIVSFPTSGIYIKAGKKVIIK